MSLEMIVQELPDLEEHIKTGDIKVVPLKRKSKLPKDKNYYGNDYPVDKLNHYHGNYGVVVGYNHEENGQSLAIVDIDGLNGDYKKETADYIYDCLKDIPGAMLVETQSGGKHIYLWNRTVSDKMHETSKHLHFPSDFPIEELAGESLKHSIEIFTKQGTKQCLLPGCVVKNKATGDLNGYHVLSQINRLQDISVVDDINETIKNTLLDHGFTWSDKISSKLDDAIDFENNGETTPYLKELSPEEVETVADILSTLLVSMDGAKHEASMDIGGYFCNRITEKSAGEICDQVIKHVSFDSDSAFKHTVLHNYQVTGEQKGLPSFLELVQEYNPGYTKDDLDRIRFKLGKVCSINFWHRILFKTVNSYQKQYLVINYGDNTIDTYTWNLKKDKKTEEPKTYYTKQFTIMNMIPKDIYEFFNVLDSNESSSLCIEFYRKGMPNPQTVKGTDIESIERQLRKRPGIVLKPRDYPGVINEIIREYIRLGLIHIVAEVPVPGLFVHPYTGELVRSDENGKVEITKPSVEDVKKGLSIWQQLHRVYPGDSKKLSSILRWGLLAPFDYILKTRYEWMKGLYLYGASQTSKTTLAQISLMPYTKITEEVSIGGGAFDSEYRIGHAVSRQGIGLVINEPSNVIEDPKLLEIIKRGKEDMVCREKQENGIHIKIPSYCNMCFTSNYFYPSKDAFVRRFNIIEFTSSERLTDEDKKKFNKEFHYVNKMNNDFQFLTGVGDFIVWYVHENLEILGNKHNLIVDEFLESLIRYCGEDVADYGWLFEETELMDVGSIDDDAPSLFRSMILKQYSVLSRNSNRFYNEATSKDAKLSNALPDVKDIEEAEKEVNARFKGLIVELVKGSHFDYLTYSQLNTGEEYIYVISSVKQALFESNGVHVTCKSLADFMNLDYKNYKIRGKQVKSFRMGVDKFVDFLRIG